MFQFWKRKPKEQEKVLIDPVSRKEVLDEMGRMYKDIGLTLDEMESRGLLPRQLDERVQKLKEEREALRQRRKDAGFDG